MSLLDNGPDTVTLYPAVWGTDDEGNTRWLPPTSDGVAWSGVSVQDSSTEVTETPGQEDAATVRVIGRALPASVDPAALTYGYAVWDGRRWHLSGRPEFRRRSPTVSHVAMVMSCRDSEQG